MEKLNNTTQILDAKLAYYHFEATRRQRLIHFIVDFMVLYVLTFLVYMLMELVGLNPPDPDSRGGAWVFRLLYFLLAIFSYSFLELRFQSTVGKYLTGTKVISVKGRQLTFGQVFLRSLLRFFPLDAITFLVHAKLHDSWSKTIVVSRAFEPNYADEDAA